MSMSSWSTSDERDVNCSVTTPWTIAHNMRKRNWIEISLCKWFVYSNRSHSDRSWRRSKRKQTCFDCFRKHFFVVYSIFETRDEADTLTYVGNSGQFNFTTFFCSFCLWKMTKRSMRFVSCLPSTINNKSYSFLCAFTFVYISDDDIVIFKRGNAKGVDLKKKIEFILFQWRC